MEPNIIIDAAGVYKIYKTGPLELVALRGLDFTAYRGEFVALVGPSGSGKSTLLNMIGGLDQPSAGRLVVAGIDLGTITAVQRRTYRQRHIGFVWQQSNRNVMPSLSVRSNIELLAALAAGQSRRERRRWSDELLAAIGMQDYADHLPGQLSGGQQQRVGLACALATRPNILLGDEPTGELDWPTACMILDLLRDFRRRYGITLVLVTHDDRVAAAADRIVRVVEGLAEVAPT